MKQKIIFCICGYTASGKDSITDSVSFTCGIPVVTSFTTRPRREGESNNKHIFISETAYGVMKETNKFAAYTQIGDYHYFTTKEQIEAIFDNHDSLLYVIDPCGIKTLKETFPDIKIVTIYINTPISECRNRSLKRGDNYLDFHKRAIAEHAQFTKMLRSADYDYAVKNDNFSKAISIVTKIIGTEIEYNNEEGEP